jgi:tRNA threonylcarbamoyladenosine biosynthesis protein TsaE
MRSSIHPSVDRVVTERELRQEGEQIGRRLASRSVVFFSGELGAGKTTLVQAVVRGLGVAGPATSPTYALVHRYEGTRGPVFHLDCYRLRTSDEAADLDWESLLRDGDIVLIEWPEKAGSYLPEPTMRCHLSHIAEDELLRRLEIQ